MAILVENSVEYDEAHITQGDKNTTVEFHGRVRIAFFTHDQVGTGDADSSIILVKLPPGRVRLLASQSKAYVNWTTATADLDIGWDAYENFAGDIVAADPNGIDDVIDVEVAGYQTFGNQLEASGGSIVFESKEGVIIRATTTTTAIVIGDDLVGYFLYVLD